VNPSAVLAQVGDTVQSKNLLLRLRAAKEQGDDGMREGTAWKRAAGS
jgi:hypothetical protein